MTRRSQRFVVLWQPNIRVANRFAKPILDILAHMIALDETSLGGSVHDLESDVA
jgi:hypothetical protein